jgi:hypothetical protein
LSEVIIWAEEEEKWFVYLRRNYLQSFYALNVENIQSMLKYYPVVNMLKSDVGVAD